MKLADSISTYKPKNFAEILEYIEGFQSSSDVSWYRGCSNSAYELKPSLYRHPSKNGIDDISELETELTTRFSQRSLPFLQRALTSDWDKLFLMQHYGVPTRLLDWSENPFVTIYFALVSAGATSDAVIWMCNPIAWNRSALDYMTFDGGILDESNTLLSQYTLGAKVANMPKSPIMIYGSYNSPRIVAQRGGFALFGKGTDPMEKVYLQPNFKKNILNKILVEGKYIHEIRDSLFRKGFTESVIFPDLDGLAKELKRAFGF